MTSLKGLKKKHPQLDLQEAKKHFKWTTEYLTEPLHNTLEIGGKEAFKSIAKSAIGYYVEAKKETNAIDHLVPYLKGEVDLEIVKNFNPLKPIYKKAKNEIIHLLHLVGVQHQKQLYCYLEFFSAYGFLVLLSDNYQGKNFTSTYTYDLINNKEIVKKVNLKLKVGHFANIPKGSLKDISILRKKIERVLRIGGNIALEKEGSRLINQALNKAMSLNGEPLNRAIINRIIIELASTLAPFMYHNRNNRSSVKI
ncbi:MAG: hypothetical protein EOO07_27810 [Chitinophagaceae bacterium]|nr:MAG: hypothetical protein EOO07_27810 [Chitinophagaceae bacterium]